MRFHILSAAALVAALAAPAWADGHGGILTFQFENDITANSDDQFTHGTRIAYMAPANEVPEWAVRLADLVPTFDPAHHHRVVYALSQSIFTPNDTERRNLIRDDRPYAGWLNLSVGLVSVGKEILDNLELNLGVVGPASQAENTQKLWHDLFGFGRPQGWHNQLRNEPTIQFSFDRKWRALWKPFGIGDMSGDLTPHMGISIGNALTHGSTGVMLRIGDNLPDDYGPPRIRPSLPGSDYFLSYANFGWYLFLGAEGRAVARNIFLDGNTFRDSHSVDKKHFVADFQAGIAMVIGDARLAYTQIYRTREYNGQSDPEIFGAVSLSLRF